MTMTLKPFDSLTLTVNQGDRDAVVLAVRGDQALVEYVMPKGTTGLRILSADGDDNGRTVSYTALSTDWLKAIVAADATWLGRPQQSGRRVLAAPAIILAERLKAKGLPFQVDREAGTTPAVQVLEDDLARFANEVVSQVQMAANPKASFYVVDLAIRNATRLVGLAAYTLAQDRPWAGLGRGFEVGPAQDVVRDGRTWGTVQEVANRPHWDMMTNDITLRREWDAVRFDGMTNGTGHPVPGGTKLTGFQSRHDAIAWVRRFGGFRIGDQVQFAVPDHRGDQVAGVFTVTDLAVSFGWSPARFEGDVTKGVPTIGLDRYMVALPDDLDLVH